MNEETKKVLDELIGPPDLIEQFVVLLKDKEINVEQREHDKRAKYFLATNTDRKVLVLAHESSKDGWWGVGGDLVRRARNGAEDPTFSLTGWGAALIDEKPNRGYWVSGEAILELSEIGLVRLDLQEKYHFNRKVLQAQTELAPSFSSIEKFLQLSGLKA